MWIKSRIARLLSATKGRSYAFQKQAIKVFREVDAGGDPPLTVDRILDRFFKRRRGLLESNTPVDGHILVRNIASLDGS